MSKISYDSKIGILSIRISNKKSTDSDINKNCVIDYDENKKIVNIDVMDINLEDVLKAKLKKAHIHVKGKKAK